MKGGPHKNNYSINRLSCYKQVGGYNLTYFSSRYDTTGQKVLKLTFWLALGYLISDGIHNGHTINTLKYHFSLLLGTL